MDFMERVTVSYDKAQKELESRIAQGVQPSSPGANLEFLICANTAYVFITLVLYLIMKRKAEGFKIRWLLQIYNVICIFAAGYVLVGIVIHKVKNPGRFACNPLLTDEDGQRLAWFFWAFYAQKFLEYADTWFFILRKSFRQVTFLHIFHHSSITLVVGLLLPFDFSGDMFLPIVFNAFVHVLMYGHYLATSLGIKSWWSKHLTSLQLIQFMTISFQSYVAYTAGPDCGAPDFAKFIMILYMISMLVLFGNFFLRKYVLRKPGADMCGVIKTAEPPKRVSYSGLITLSNSGSAVIHLPKWFQRPSDVEFSYQLTPVGAAMPSLHVSEEIGVRDTFSVAGGVPSRRVSWQVIAEQPPAENKQKSA
eukprot:TRINITY_DN4452_c0_g1_i1.p1 TRINITY_DN4452_c0_g1~~TRINITY_DN4452_c0_g1_i1.p1  ORF type:complete len:364 (+),score=59.90 TRINITY_DN4452_c0_g1_i1:494-1585(+)